MTLTFVTLLVNFAIAIAFYLSGYYNGKATKKDELKALSDKASSMEWWRNFYENRMEYYRDLYTKEQKDIAKQSSANIPEILN